MTRRNQNTTRAAMTVLLAMAAYFVAFGGYATAAVVPPRQTVITLTKASYQSPLGPSQWFSSAVAIQNSRKWDNWTANVQPVTIRAVTKTSVRAGEIFPVKVTLSRTTRTKRYGNWKRKGPTIKTTKLAGFDPTIVRKVFIGYTSNDTSWIAQQLAQGVPPEKMLDAVTASVEDTDKTIDMKFEQEVGFFDKNITRRTDGFKLTESGKRRTKTFTVLLTAPKVCTPWNAGVRKSLFDVRGEANSAYNSPEQTQRVCPPLELRIRAVTTMNNKNTRRIMKKRGVKLPKFHAGGGVWLTKPGLELLP